MTAVQLEPLLRRMRSLGSRRNVLGMARYGIRPARAFGLPASELYRLSRELGRDHALARRLWATGIHDARALAILVEDPERVSSTQMDRWAKGFDSWAVCDGACLHLIGKRNPALNGAAIRAAEGIRARGTRAARWIAADALRELRSEAVRRRLRLRARRSEARGRRSR